MNDLHVAFRQLRKNPSFTVVAVLTLALGIGANTAIYSAVDQWLLRALPVHQPQELVRVGAAHGNNTSYSFNFPFYVDFRDQCPAFAALAAYAEIPVSLLAEDEVERVTALLVTENYFSMLGIEAALGRVLPPEDLTGLVISHQFWQRRFGADPAVIGRQLEVNRRPFTIVGITPAEFHGTVVGSAPEVYLPFAAPGLLSSFDPQYGDPLQSRSLSWVNLLGRLQPGTSREQAQVAARALLGNLDRRGHGLEPEQLLVEESSRGDNRQVLKFKLPLLLIQTAVGLVLVIACANIANLLMVRAIARRREMAIRLAVGATRCRLIRQLLSESLLLSLAGCLAGIALATWLIPVLANFAPLTTGLPALNYALDVRVLSFSILLALLAGTGFGLAPALQAAWTGMLPGLQEGGSLSSSQRCWSVRSFLVVGQVALCVVVLAGAVLCIRSARKLQAIDPGYDAAKVLVMSFDLDQAGLSGPSKQNFWPTLLERVRALPGVEAASLASSVGLGDYSAGISLDELDGYEAKPNELIGFRLDVVSPDYFRTLGRPLLRGRDFTKQDTSDSPPVAVINEVMANRFWPGRDPIGMRLRLPRLAAPPPTPGSGAGLPKSSEQVEIVGVVRAWKNERLTVGPVETMFRPVTQVSLPRLSLHLRSSFAPKQLLPAVRREVHSLDAHMPLFNIRTLEEQKASSTSLQRTTAIILGWFGILALALTALGLYGVIAFGVVQRTREIGLRMALGAPRREVLRMLLRWGMKLTGVGLVFGLAGAFGLTRLLRSLLFGISPTDPLTFVTVPLVLILVAMLACWFPARRATHIHPMEVLRDF